MKKYKLVIAFMLLFGHSYSQSIEWGYQFGPEHRGISPFHMCTDTIGNSYVSGRDLITLPASLTFISKIDSSGQEQWRMELNDDCWWLTLSSMTTDHAGNLYMIGYSDCSLLDLGPFHFYEDTGVIGRIVVKIDPLGNILLIKKVMHSMVDIGADDVGNIYLTGPDATQKLNPLGIVIWTNTNYKGHAISIQNTGKVYITNGTATYRLFTNGTFSWQNDAVGGRDIAYCHRSNKVYVVNASGLVKLKFTPTGSVMWNKGAFKGEKVVCNTNGEVFVLGDGLLKKITLSGISGGNTNAAYGREIGADYKGKGYVLGKFDNLTEQYSSCNFTTILTNASTCNTICGNDGYVVRSDYSPAKIITNYNYTSACYGQTNPVTLCTDRSFNLNNKFRIEMSDANGSFSNPLFVGFVPTAVIPSNLPLGQNYRFRISSTSPVVIGVPSSTFNIENTIGPLTIVTDGPATLCDSGYVRLKAVDSNNVPIICEWYGDEFYQDIWEYKHTGTYYTSFIEGEYYASYLNCSSITDPFDIGIDCGSASRLSEAKFASESGNLICYPNPAMRIINVKSTRSAIDVFDMTGRKIFSVQKENEEISIDVSEWLQGLYIVHDGLNAKKISIKH